ncbi:hypothetical protein ELQ35_15740 [Peribacillus cavernae]|uniref:Uncharacterized protein n=2 Tax=Peribacillus cavernae TaxID=1674310 RepID=A0A3S0TYW1_9BACI|nr:hypothetical protein [Peribacillus cavernae]RUQ27444.1 hypothetical protein ELQ35_15740 [Peribacillus cavernae]
MQPISDPKEYRELHANLKISAEFDMRYRGLLEFFGKDLISYKREHSPNQNRNEFLRIFSKYMTDYLEDHCPPSWKQCTPSFWEEFMFTYYPYCMHVTPHGKEVVKFLFQLKKFVKWLDKRAGTTWFEVIEKYVEESSFDLKMCEHLLNTLYLRDFPRIHHTDWKPKQDSDQIERHFNKYTETLESLFEITRITDDTVILTGLKSHRTYCIKGLPHKAVFPGLLMYGIIGKKDDDIFWNWCHTESVYPQRAKNYIIIDS